MFFKNGFLSKVLFYLEVRAWVGHRLAVCYFRSFCGAASKESSKISSWVKADAKTVLSTARFLDFLLPLGQP